MKTLDKICSKGQIYVARLHNHGSTVQQLFWVIITVVPAVSVSVSGV